MRNFILVKLFLLFLSLHVSGQETNGGERKMLVTLRKIGNDILLQSGDTTSWIPPVEKVNAGDFRVRFEKPFAFSPDSLVRTVHRHLATDQLPLQYLVEVRNRKDKKVVYSYQMTGSPENSTIPCLQRNPPTGVYEIQVHFSQPLTQTSGISGTGTFLWFLLPVLLAGAGWQFFRHRNVPASAPSPEMAIAIAEEEQLVTIGRLSFCPDKQILRVGTERVELSAKESKLLKIFFLAPNQIIDRSQLMKQVWEDEGVFVGRSLDVFVSRLRKKLQPEASVRIVNIHGKGYKLEVDLPGNQVKYA